MRAFTPSSPRAMTEEMLRQAARPTDLGLVLRPRFLEGRSADVCRL